MAEITVETRCGEKITLKVGDWVGFKCDTEQYGQIKEISRNQWRGYELVLENNSGFIGEYIGGQIRTTVDADEVWVD